MNAPSRSTAPADPHVTAARLAAIVESSSDAIVGKDLHSIITSWNPGAEKIFGYTAAEMVGTSILRIIPADRREEEEMILGKIRRGERVEPFDTQRLTRDGRLLDMSITASPIRDEAGQIVGVSKIARDVTPLKEREREIARLLRLYAALSQVNHAIVLTRTRDELLQKVCEVLVEHGGFSLVWIGWHDPATHRLVPVAVCGDEKDYVKNIQVYSDDRSEGRGPSGQAFRDGRPWICNDLLNHPSTLAWRDEIRCRGFRSSVALPIRCQQSVCGTLNVYADEARFFREKELALLVEAAGDISFGLDGFVRDEERRQAEEKLSVERHFSAAMLNSLPGVLYLYDQAGRFLRWNENFERVTGYTAAEIATMHPLDFFAGADKERVGARIGAVFASGEASVEAGFLAKDGRVTPYYFTGVVTKFDERTCLVGVGIDISARVQAEEARLASEALYHTLFDYAPDGILIADARSTYLDANPSMCRMLGYTRRELIGLNAVDIIAPDEVAGVGSVLGELQARTTHHREWRFRRKDGSVFPAEVIATLMPDGNLMGMIRDITDRKQAEAALRDLNAGLEEKIATRTRELQEALVRAEAADRLKSAFLATMSHELRTPLNSIIGFTGIILQGLAGPLNAEQAKQLGMVRGSARHLLELINDVLDISKIEAGQLTIRPEAFDLRAAIERVAGSVRPMAEKKELTFSVTLPADLPTMVSDRRRVEQVLLNLLNNAIKFTDRGSVTLVAEMVADFIPNRLAPAQAAVRLQIVDTGIGIKPESVPALFQPFRQIDSGLSRQHEGTGLGLAICRRLVALLLGEITVTSEWGRGSVFTVTLPLKFPN